MGALGRLSTRLAVPRTRDARIFAVAAIVDALGNGLFQPVTALFFVKVAGLSATTVGVGLSLAGAVSLVGPVLGGPVIDRSGARRTVVMLMLVRGVGYLAYPFVRGFWPFVAVAALNGVADNMSRPAMQALVATIAEEGDRVTTLAFVRSIRNVGYGAGGLLVGVALAVGGRGPYVALVVGDAVTFGIAAVLLRRVRDVHVPVPRGAGGGYRTVLRDRRFVALTALHGVVSLHLSVLLVGFPLWIDQRTSAPTAMAGVVFTVNCVLVAAFQVGFSRRVVTVRDGGKALRRSTFALAATCVLLVLTPGLPALAASVLLLVTGVLECAAEMWEAAGGWAVSLGLAPEELRGRYLGVWSLGFSVVDIAGPALMAYLVARGGRTGLPLFGAAVALVGIVAARLASVDSDGGEPLPEGFDSLDDRVDDADLAT